MDDQPRAGSAGLLPSPSAGRRTSGFPPPGLGFHLLLVVVTLPLLWALSLPGADVFLLSGTLPVLFVLAVAWVTWLVLYCLRQNRCSWAFAAAPLGGMLVLVLLAANAPMHARWALSKDAFDDEVARLTAAGADSTGRGPVGPVVTTRLGLYDVVSIDRVPGGLMFQEETGLWLDYAGFAYLPDGPSRTLRSGYYESLTVQHLGGDWYAWTSSW